MPPKAKFTKQALIDAAIALIREDGIDALSARNLGTRLCCSSRPIFTLYKSMNELQHDVLIQAYAHYRAYIDKETASQQYPPYKASGMAYIRFAKEEKELFRLLYMRDRTDETIPESDDLENQMETMVQNNTGLSDLDAKLFHLEMWAYVHGIATMFATGFLNLDWELVSRMLTDSYRGLRKQYGMEE